MTETNNSQILFNKAKELAGCVGVCDESCSSFSSANCAAKRIQKALEEAYNDNQEINKEYFRKIRDLESRPVLEEAISRMFAAEKQVEKLKDDLRRIEHCRDNMKIEAGYSTNVSFDVVWSAALSALKGAKKKQ